MALTRLGQQGVEVSEVWFISADECVCQRGTAVDQNVISKSVDSVFHFRLVAHGD